MSAALPRDGSQSTPAGLPPLTLSLLGAAAMAWDEPSDDDWDFDAACEEQEAIAIPLAFHIYVLCFCLKPGLLALVRFVIGT